MSDRAGRRLGARSRIQGGLISAFGRVQSSAALRHPAGRRSFEALYGTYKVLIEAGPVRHLRAYTPIGSLVIDVGANIGFFTVRFARWVGPSGSVVAVEPEDANADRLSERLRRKGLDDRVRVIRAAATDHDGRTLLATNPLHPGDHKIGDTGLDVEAVTVDSLVAGHGQRRVSLVKVDVQGAEQLVLDGAKRTLAEHRPALFVEVMDEGLRDFGCSAAALFGGLESIGYDGHLLGRMGVGTAVPALQLEAMHADGYGDVLFLPRSP